MGLLEQTQQQYYDRRKSFTGDGSTTTFTVSNSQNTFHASTNYTNASVYINNSLIINSSYEFKYLPTLGWHVDFSGGTGTVYGAPANGDAIVVHVGGVFGGYQHVSIHDIINNFMISHVGQNKILSRVDRTDVAFHAQRALQELSYDTLRSIKTQEIEVPSSLVMMIPQDYVNYVKLTWSDSSGIEHIIYPALKTSNPRAIKQDTDGNYSFDIDDDTTVLISDRDDTTDLIHPNNSDTFENYKSSGGLTNTGSAHLHGSTSHRHYDEHSHGSDHFFNTRYGLDPQYAQANGSFFIDEIKGLIHFSSNLSGETITLKYISDSLGLDSEMIVHKFAEEAMYKWIAYAILSTRMNTPEHIVQRFKKEKVVETRKAKLRLSNIKLEEITQILRGKSKQLKH